MYLHHLWTLKKLLNSTNYIHHQNVLKMNVSWSCFIECPLPIISEFCNIRFTLPWVFRYLFLPSFYLFYLFSSCFCFLLFFSLLLSHFPLFSFLHTLPVFQNCSQLSVWLPLFFFFEWSFVYNKHLWEEKFCLRLLTSKRIQTIQQSVWKMYTKSCNVLGAVHSAALYRNTFYLGINAFQSHALFLYKQLTTPILIHGCELWFLLRK